jgi:transposase
LEQRVRTRTSAQRVVERARIVLASAEGEAGSAIAARLAVSRPTVSLWLDRYDTDGLSGLVQHRPRAGRPKTITAADEAAIIHRTLHTSPPQGTHWSTRLMAAATGCHHATIARL